MALYPKLLRGYALEALLRKGEKPKDFDPEASALRLFAENGGDAPNPASLAGKLVVTFDDGQTMTARIDKTWKASNNDFKGNDMREWLQFDTRGWKKWIQPSYDDSSWPAVKELGPVVEKPSVVSIPPRGCPLLRKEFRIDQPIRRATL